MSLDHRTTIDLLAELVRRGARVRRDNVLALDTLCMSQTERRNLRLLRHDGVAARIATRAEAQRRNRG